MTFKEFLWANGEEKLANIVDKFNFAKPLSESVHQKALKFQREFLFVGGMPAAVLEFSKDRDFKKTKKIQSEILEVYGDDFNKYARESVHPRLRLIMDYALLHMGEKVMYSKISSDYQAKELKRALDLLSQARVITKVYNTSSQGIPLKKGIDPFVFKLLFLDVGLLNFGLRLDWRDLLNISERELLNEGPLAEQFVGQHLREWCEDFEEIESFFWLREGHQNAAEVDFLLQRSRDILAIEVKAGAAGSMRSLHQWNKDIDYPHKVSLRFDLNPPARFQVNLNTRHYDLVSLPLYFAAFINPSETELF